MRGHRKGEFTDNCNINIAYFGDQLYAMTETNFIRRIDPKDLKSIGQKTNLKDYVVVNHATAHPHILPDGSAINLGSRFTEAVPSSCCDMLKLKILNEFSGIFWKYSIVPKYIAS